MMMFYNCTFLGKIVDSRVTSKVGVTDEHVGKYASCVVICKFH